LLIGLTVVIVKLSNAITLKKVNKIESEMDENDFVMKVVTEGFTYGILWIVWTIIIFIYTRLANFDAIWIIILAVVWFLSFAWMVWSIWVSLQQKIIVKDNTITYYKFQRKVTQITFDEISNATSSESKNRSHMNFYGENGEIIFTLPNYWWEGQSLLIKRLIYSGKTPLFEIPPFLRYAPKKNKEMTKNSLNTMTELVNFLIEEDLTTWNSFDENGFVDIDFELYYHDLTEEGQHLFTSNTINKWINLPLIDGNISEISDFILFLKAALMEMRS